MAYLSNIYFQNRGDMSALLTRPVDRTNPVLGVFVWMDWNRRYFSFLLESWWIKGGRKLARDGGKSTLPQMQSPMWLS